MSSSDWLTDTFCCNYWGQIARSSTVESSLTRSGTGCLIACTNMATVGVKGLSKLSVKIIARTQNPLSRQDESTRLDWIVQCFTSPPTQYRLYGRRFLQVKKPKDEPTQISTQLTGTQLTRALAISHHISRSLVMYQYRATALVSKQAFTQ